MGGLLVRAGFFFSEVWENMQMRGEGDVFHSDLAWLAYIMKWMRVILSPSASFTCFFFFFPLLKKHHHLRCGQKQWMLAQLHLLMERKKNKPLVPSVVWIPSKLRLSLIGLKEWEPERINGFCWSIQGWTQRKWQCVFVCLCQCVTALQPLLRVRNN